MNVKLDHVAIFRMPLRTFFGSVGTVYAAACKLWRASVGGGITTRLSQERIAPFTIREAGYATRPPMVNQSDKDQW